MPHSERRLSDLGGDTSDIQRPGHSQPVTGSVIEDTPAETSVNLHGEVPAVEQQTDCVRPVVTEQLVTGDKNQSVNMTRCLAVRRTQSMHTN